MDLGNNHGNADIYGMTDNVIAMWKAMERPVYHAECEKCGFRNSCGSAKRDLATVSSGDKAH